jgi:ARG and Rhodanese-Phosphatase-superfamily-associated Protein domain
VNCSSRNRLRREIALVEDQVGVVVQLAGSPVAFDLVSRHEVFADLLPRLAEGYALLGFEALYAANVSRTEQSADGAQEFLDAVLGSRRTWLPTPGMGEAFSLSDRRVEGCGLAAERELIVLSAFPATD